MRLVVGTGVLELEALRQVEVQLDRRALPETADGGAELDIDLGAIDTPAPLVHPEVDPFPLQRALQRGFGPVPDGIIAQPLGWPSGDLEVQLEAEGLPHHTIHLVEAQKDLVLDLIGSTEDV